MAAESAGTGSASAVGAETPRRRAFLFPRSARIASRRRFEELYASDPKRVGRYVVAWHAPSETASHRLGVTAAKRTFRDAHERNRAKRLMREAFRLLVKDGRMPEGVEWVFVGRSSLGGKKVQDVVEDIAAVGARVSGGAQPSVR